MATLEDLIAEQPDSLPDRECRRIRQMLNIVIRSLDDVLVDGRTNCVMTKNVWQFNGRPRAHVLQRQWELWGAPSLVDVLGCALDRRVELIGAEMGTLVSQLLFRVDAGPIVLEDSASAPWRRVADAFRRESRKFHEHGTPPILQMCGE